MPDTRSMGSLSQLLSASGPLLLLTLAIAGCGLPSYERDEKIGSRVNRQVRQQIGVIEDDALRGYLNDLAERLARGLEGRRFFFSLQIVDQKEPNAFAAPGGYVFVSRGLLALTNSEDELAGVIGHEMIHVTERHTAQQMQRTKLPNILLFPGRLVGTVLSEDLGNLINSPVNTVGSAVLASYGRGQESESDRLGLELAAKAGYSPESLADILARIEQAMITFAAYEPKKSFFDSHPSTPDREKKIEAWSQDVGRVSRDPISPDREAYLRRWDGLVIGENPAGGIFREQQFLHSGLDISIVFPEGWKVVNTPSAAGAVAPESEGVMFVGVEGADWNPTEAAEIFRGRMQQKHRVEPSLSEAVEVGAWPAHVLSYDDVSESPPMNLYVLWVKTESALLKVIATAPERSRPVLREAVLSMQPLTAEERESIEIVRLRIARSKGEESLSELSFRTGNIFSPEQTAVINGLEAGATLEEGQLVKVGRREPFRPERATGFGGSD